MPVVVLREVCVDDDVIGGACVADAMSFTINGKPMDHLC